MPMPSDEPVTEFHFASASPDDTLRLGRALGAGLSGGEMVALVGPLGAGKTHLVKGVAVGNGLGDPRAVTSPTFVLVKEYAGRLRLFHLDAYRVAGEHELRAVGLDEMISPDGAVILEWADRVAGVVPEDALWIRLSVTGPTHRSIRLSAGGGTGAALLARTADRFR